MKMHKCRGGVPNERVLHFTGCSKTTSILIDWKPPSSINLSGRRLCLCLNPRLYRLDPYRSMIAAGRILSVSVLHPQTDISFCRETFGTRCSRSRSHGFEVGEALAVFVGGVLDGLIDDTHAAGQRKLPASLWARNHGTLEEKQSSRRAPSPWPKLPGTHLPSGSKLRHAQHLHHGP
jgi:hypothetical protein